MWPESTPLPDPIQNPEFFSQPTRLNYLSTAELHLWYSFTSFSLFGPWRWLDNFMTHTPRGLPSLLSCWVTASLCFLPQLFHAFSGACYSLPLPKLETTRGTALIRDKSVLIRLSSDPGVSNPAPRKQDCIHRSEPRVPLTQVLISNFMTRECLQALGSLNFCPIQSFGVWDGTSKKFC